MQITTHADYAATPDAVFAVITDPAFVAEKAKSMSVGGHAADVSAAGDRTKVTSTRTLPTTDLPDIARKVVGDVLTLTEEQVWGPAAPDGSRTADLKLNVVGAPVTLRGTIRLAPSATGARQDVKADLSAKVPLIGGSIEKAAAPAIVAGINYEVELVQEWLARS